MIDAASTNDAALSTTTPRAWAFAIGSALLLSSACATTQEATRAPSADDEALREIAREHTHQIANAVQLYWYVNQDYPSHEDGLRALLDPPKGKPVFRVLPRDPWGREFLYRRPGAYGAEFDVYSRGPDGEAGTPDDVGSWEVRRPPRGTPSAPVPTPKPPPSPMPPGAVEL